MHCRFFFVISLLIGLSFNACKDNQPPQIFTPTFGNDAAFYSGDTMLLELTLVDNEEIERLQYFIFPENPDSLPGTITDLFSASGEAAATGNTAFIAQQLAIPDSAATGSYFLQVVAMDVSGNASLKVFPFTLQNSLDQVGPEMIKENIPDTLQSGMVTTIKATVLDDVALAEVKIVVRQNATSNVVFFRKMPVTSGLIQLNETLTFPLPGNYTISFELRDWVNNITSADYTISVI